MATTFPALLDMLPAGDHAGQRLRTATIVFGVVMVFCALGILTRMPGLLASFWPANGVLLGLMVRWRRCATPECWIAAALAFTLSGVVLGDPWLKALLLTVPNLAGVAVGYVLYRRVGSEEAMLAHPRAMVHLVTITLVAATTAGLCGAAISPFLFDSGFVEAFLYWTVAELLNYSAVLPLLLSFPKGLLVKLRSRSWRRGTGTPILRGVQPGHLAPVGILAASLALGLYAGGASAIPYPLPALLLCALSYSVFTTASLTLAFVVWTTMALALGYLAPDGGILTRVDATSWRFGVMLLGLAPLTVASTMAARNSVVRKLEHAVSHDYLTGVLNRSGFMQQASAMLAQLAAKAPASNAAVLMLDLDHFKRINDDHGHATGDRVLASVQEVAGQCLREGDIVGRLGGEEFAVLLPHCDASVALSIGQRFCEACAQQPFLLDDGRVLPVTMSVGVSVAPARSASLQDMLTRADAALYDAKRQGRNRAQMRAG